MNVVDFQDITQELGEGDTNPQESPMSETPAPRIFDDVGHERVLEVKAAKRTYDITQGFGVGKRLSLSSWANRFAGTDHKRIADVDHRRRVVRPWTHLGRAGRARQPRTRRAVTKVTRSAGADGPPGPRNVACPPGGANAS